MRAFRTALCAIALALTAAPFAVAQDLPTLRVAGCVCDDFKSVQYGVQSGIFKRYGLNVVPVNMSSGTASLASVAGGDTQVALASTVPILQAFARNIPIKVVVPGQWYLSDAPTTALFVRADSPIQSARDLNGKTISVQSLKDLTWAATLAWIEKGGGDVNSIKIVELPFPTVTAALDENRIAAGSLGVPFIQQAISSGKARLLANTYDAIAPRFEAAMWVATNDYVESHKDIMNRFVRAMHESIVFTNAKANEKAVNNLVVSFTKLDPDVVAKSIHTTDPEYLEPAYVKPLIDVSYRYKLIDRQFAPQDLFSSVLLKAPK